MATKIQLRRGTAAEWTNYSPNPVLSIAEAGFESDTGKFKIGNGVATWNELDYATLLPSEVSSQINSALPVAGTDFIAFSEKGTAGGVAELDGDGYVPASQLPPLAKITVSSVADQTARLALNVEVGDIAIQTDTGASWVLQTAGASTNSHWKQLVGTENVQDIIGNSLGTGLSYDDTTGIISVTASTYDAYGAAAAIIPSQTGNANKYLQTDGTSLKWTTQSDNVIGPISLTTNDPFLIDYTLLANFDLIDYTIYIKQGSLYRASKLFILTDGTDVSADEYAISELGGLMNGVSVSASVDGGTRVILQVQILDATTSNASIKLIKNVV